MPIRETSDRQVNDLLSDFTPKGGVYTKLPNIKEVRDLTMIVLKQGTAKYLMMAIDGKWEMINCLTPTWNDLRFPASLGKLPAVSYPSWSDYKGGQILNFSTGEKVFFLVQLPHTWIEGTSIEPHLHLVISGTPANNIGFTLTHSFANIKGIFPQETTVVKEMSIADKVTGEHFLLEFDPIVMNNFTISNMGIISLTRTAPTGTDYANDVGLLELDFRIQQRVFGSEEEYKQLKISEGR